MQWTSGTGLSRSVAPKRVKRIRKEARFASSTLPLTPQFQAIQSSVQKALTTAVKG